MYIYICIELYRYEVYTHKCYVYSRNGITVLPGPMLRYIDEATLLFWFLLTYSTAEKKKNNHSYLQLYTNRNLSTAGPTLYVPFKPLL